MPRVLNMPVLHRVLYQTTHHIPWLLNMLGFECTYVVNMSTLHIVLCKLYFNDSQYLECLEF